MLLDDFSAPNKRIINKKYVVYLDGNPAIYQDTLRDAEGDVYDIKKLLPNGKVEIRQEICYDEIISKSQSYIEESLDENLKQWFKEKWVRFGPDGKIRGDCARGDSSEGKPKCLPQAKAHALGKKGRKYAASKKRREDPNPERSGSAINVATKKKQGVAEGQLNENQNSGIVYATGPRKMGTNDVNLIFKNLNTNKIVAWVVGNNDDGGVYEIRINQNGVKKGPPNFVATGNPQDDSNPHLIYKLGKPGTGRMSAIGSVMQNGFDKKNSTYYGQPLEFVGDDDWWSFLENIIGDITWEDDAIDAGYVDRLDNGDLVFVKQNLSKDSLNELAPTKFVGNFNRGGGGAGRGGDDDGNERDDSDDEGIINKILQALERLQPDPFETYGGEVEDVVVNLVSSGRLDDYIRAVGMGNIPMKELIKQGVIQTLKELNELYGDQGVAESQLNELAPNPGGGDGGGRDDGDDGFELPLDFKGQNIMVWPRNKKHSMGDTATPFPRGERFTGKVYIMWDRPKIEAIWYLDPKDREDREAEYERVYGPQGRGWEDWLDHKWYDTTGVRYRFVTDWRLIPAKEPGGWPGIVDAWGQDMKAEVINYPESFITEIIQKDGDGRHFVEPRQNVAEGSLNEFAPGDGSGEGRWYTDDQMIDMVGPDWAPEDDAGHLSLGQRLQDAQAWLDDKGYSVVVEDVQIDPEGGYRWKIYGEFYNPRFAKKDQGVAEGSDKTFTVVYYSKKTDRNVTKQIKASSKSELWDRLRAKGIDVVSIEEQGVAEGSVWSSADQKMKHHSEFPHTHTAVKDIRSSMTDKIIVPKGARLSALGNDNYLNLDTGVQPFKLDPTSLVKQGVAEGEVVPFRRSQQAKLTWQQLPKDVLQLANDWYWASEDDFGLDAVMDPEGYGSGTKNDVRYFGALLQQRGWSIDFNDEHDKPGESNLILKNKLGQSVLLPIKDAQNFSGWAQDTDGDLREQDVGKGAEEDSEKIKGFHQSLGNAIRGRVSQMQANMAILKAQHPDTWLWEPGDIVYSTKTGRTYKIVGPWIDSHGTAKYLYQGNDEEKGTFVADKAHKTLKKLSEDQGVAEGFTDDINLVYAMHPQPEESERVALGILDMDENEFIAAWQKLPAEYQEEFNFDLPLWNTDELKNYKHITLKVMKFADYVKLVEDYIRSQEMSQSAVSALKKGVAEGWFFSSPEEKAIKKQRKIERYKIEIDQIKIKLNIILNEQIPDLINDIELNQFQSASRKWYEISKIVGLSILDLIAAYDELIPRNDYWKYFTQEQEKIKPFSNAISSKLALFGGFFNQLKFNQQMIIDKEFILKNLNQFYSVVKEINNFLKKDIEHKQSSPMGGVEPTLDLDKFQEGVAEDRLNEFVPDDTNDGIWYNDNKIAKIVGRWWLADDLLSNSSNIYMYGDEAKESATQEAEEQLREKGFYVNVLDVRENTKKENLDWLISGPLVRVHIGKQGITEATNRRKEATLRIQKMLNDKFNANLDVDGILGPLTIASINKFMPNAKVKLADEPNRTTAVQGNKMKKENVNLESRYGDQYNVNKTTSVSLAKELNDMVLELGELIAASPKHPSINRLKDKIVALNQELNDLGYDYDPQAENFLTPITLDMRNLHEGICPKCKGSIVAEIMINEKQDSCYYKVKSRYKVWPSAYASGALVQCRKKGAKNWGKKNESKNVNENKIYFSIPKSLANETELRESFNLRHDAKGWYLKEGQENFKKSYKNALKAFPVYKDTSEGFDMSKGTGSAPIKGDDFVLSPVGSIPKNKK